MLSRDINKIKSSRNPFKEFDIEFILITPNKRFDNRSRFFKITSYSITRDYINNYCDLGIVTVLFPIGEYREFIKSEEKELTGIIRYSFDKKHYFKEEYIATLIASKETNKYDSVFNSLNPDELNEIGILTLEFQLTPLSVKGLKYSYPNGIYKEVQIENIIKTNIAHSYKSVNINNKQVNLPIHIEKIPNTYLYDTIMLPTGVNSLNIGHYFQNSPFYGLYNGGCGTYIQKYYKDKYNDTLDYQYTYFLYSLYNRDKYFDKDTLPKLYLYKDISLQSFGEYNNIRIDNRGDIHIVVNQESKLTLDTVNKIHDKGIGVYFSTPQQILNDNFELHKGTVVTDKSQQLQKKVLTNNAVNSGFTNYAGQVNNQYKVIEEYLANQMELLSFKWPLGCIDLLYPSMPVQFTYYDDTIGIVKLYGTVLKTYFHYNSYNSARDAVVTVALGSKEYYGID